MSSVRNEPIPAPQLIRACRKRPAGAMANAITKHRRCVYVHAEAQVSGADCVSEDEEDDNNSDIDSAGNVRGLIDYGSGVSSGEEQSLDLDDAGVSRSIVARQIILIPPVPAPEDDEEGMESEEEFQTYYQKLRHRRALINTIEDSSSHSHEQTSESACEDAAPFVEADAKDFEHAGKTPPTRNIRKRPAAKSKEKHQCGGWTVDGVHVHCKFSHRHKGEKAIPFKHRGQCLFCSEGLLTAVVATIHGKGCIVRGLKKFVGWKGERPDIYDEAVQRLQKWLPDSWTVYLAKSTKPIRSNKRGRKNAPVQKLVKDWARAKAYRASTMARASSPERREYRAAVLADQRITRVRFWPKAERRKRATPAELKEDVPNDTGLPPASYSEISKGLETWCLRGAWGMCTACHSIQARPMHQRDIEIEPSPDLPKSQCKRCASKRQAYVPKPEDVPHPLRGLSEKALMALRPFDIDVGSEVRAKNEYGFETGYRKHTKMFRLSWSSDTVKRKVKSIKDKDMRRRARAAYKYLRSETESSHYSLFVNEHKKFLTQHENCATDAQRRRPVQIIEAIGIECALWPHLYWRTHMCETYERSTDCRRGARKVQRSRGRSESDSNSDGEDDRSSDQENSSKSDDEKVAGEGSRHSVKKSFLAKMHSPLLGYGASFELVQFVYDLCLWTDLGSKKNLKTGVPLRLMMRGHTFSPMYWKRVHHGLIDLVRQLGYPNLFFTMSPYEWSAPYHEFLKDEMACFLRKRLRLPAFETLHLAHTLLQIVSGCLTGMNQQQVGHRTKRWTKHVLSCKNDSGKRTVLNYFSRLEFQDGSRKAPTQAYHGSGRVHLHCILWLENMETINLDKVISATVPPDPLGAYVKGSQEDRDGNSRWPVREEPSTYDEDRDLLLLQHTEEDSDTGRRAYFPDIMDAMRCHQDLQCANGAALLLQYVSKYVSKFSDSSYDDWLNDEASADSVAWRVLKEYHPMEPEVILQIAGANYRQWSCGTEVRGMRHLLAPDGRTETAELKAYMKSSWRSDTMCFLEFLRKSTKKGKINGWLKRKHKHAVASGAAQSLVDFANSYTMRGEYVVAVDMVYRMNDKFYIQWLLLNIPFRKLADILSDEVAAKVPEGTRNFAYALKCCDDASRVPASMIRFWRSEDKIRKDMQAEAHIEEFIADTIHFITAQTRLVDMYLNGALQNEENEKRSKELAAAISAATLGPHVERTLVFNQQQKIFDREIQKRVDIALAANHSEIWEEADAARDLAGERNKPLVCLGPPGTGKTTVVVRRITEAIEQGARVLFALPTAQLASRMRSRFEGRKNIVVDTCHAAFKLNGDQAESFPLMTGFDLVVVDEISLLDQPQFDLILRLWRVADKVPALIFLGDKWQLPGIGSTRPWESSAWTKRSVRFVKLIHPYRCKDPDFRKILDALRTSKPTKKSRLVERICRGRKAWGGQEPSVKDLSRLYKSHPHTTIVTCTRRGASTVNNVAVQALFPNKKPRVVLGGDIEVNPLNYDRGKLKEKGLVPSEVPIFNGMKLYLTRNIRKEEDYVNGMSCTVEQWYDIGRCLRVVTKTGKRLMITPWTDKSHDNATYYPIRLGYASTIHKVQGDEFKHITIWLDVKNMPAAGYTALSRVEFQKSYLIGGNMSVDHFVPAF
jgi:hypothetical protein